MAAQGVSRKRLLAKHRANILMGLHEIQGYPLLKGFPKVLIRPRSHTKFFTIFSLFFHSDVMPDHCY